MKVLNQEIGKHFAAYHGDSCEVIKGIPDNSIHYSIFSPPFASLFTYSDSTRDMGNSGSWEEFQRHFEFLVKELYRVMMPGRLISFHCQNLPTSKVNHGYIGLHNFRGDILRVFQDCGFIYHSEVTIWKDPVVQQQRTKAIGLLHKQLCKDSSLSRQGLPDYLVTVRKPGENPEPIAGMLMEYVGDDPALSRYEFMSEGYVEKIQELLDGYLSKRLNSGRNSPEAKRSIDIWQRYASPVWMDIQQNNTLNRQAAREEQDERHICLAKDSLVLTRQDGYKPIQNVQIGDLVLTHKGRWMPVIAKQKTSDSADVVKIRATGVHDLTVTPDHKLWTRYTDGAKSHYKNKAKSVEPSWVEAQNLKNSFVNLKLPSESSSELTAQEWWIVGRWLADGHMHTRSDDGRTSIHLSIGNHKLDYAYKMLGDYAGSTHSPGNTCTQIRIKDPDRKLRNVIAKCGKFAHEKQFPTEAFELNHELSSALLDGYLSGDGYFLESRQRWSVASVSKPLLLGLQMIVQKVYGVTSTLHAGRKERTKVIQGREINCKPEWVLSFQSGGYGFSFVSDDGAWKKVKSVDNAGQSETWNIRVAEDASYTAEGCIVKNCPLQLDVIHRGLQLWSNPNDIVFSPFMGIGSEGYESIKCGRRFVGCELKESYFNVAVQNLRQIENMNAQQMALF